MAEGNEFFYLDEAGTKQDAELHDPILRAVDGPVIDEKIMAPIRARHRAEHQAQQQAKARTKRWQRIKAKAEARLAHGHGDVTTMIKIVERADRRLETGQNGLYRVWNEDDHPRAPAGSPDGGQFVGSGGGSGGSAGSRKPDAGGPGAGSGADGGVPRAFSRESPSDADRERNVVAIWRPSAEAEASFSAKGKSAHPFYELAGSGGAKTFASAINRAKSGEFGAAVHAYAPEEYEGMRLFMAPDGTSGFALKGTDIVSLFKHPQSQIAGVAPASLKLATELGGRRLDCFDTQLPFLYAKSGFAPVARLKWNEEYKPEGWDKATFKAFNNGEPDVVFMTYKGPDRLTYEPGSSPYVKEYDEGTAAQLRAISYAPGVLTPDGGSFPNAKTVKAGWIDASPIKTIEDVKREAPEAQKALGEVGRQIEAKLGLQFKDPGPKTKSEKGVQRILTKAKQRGGNLAAVTDTARGSFIVNHPEDTDKIIAELGKHFEVAAEPWKRTGEDYFDRAMNVRLPNGVIAELQMMHPKMAWAKSPDGGGGHDLYNISRDAAEGGEHPDPEKYAAAVKAQRELYGKAMSEMPGDWKALFAKAVRAAKQLGARLLERFFR